MKNKTLKRRIHCNRWGNWMGYEGTRSTQDFGLDEREARDWLALGTRTPVDKVLRLGPPVNRCETTRRPLDMVDSIMRFEDGEMPECEMVEFLTQLRDSGMLRHLQGCYHRTAHAYGVI